MTLKRIALLLLLAAPLAAHSQGLTPLAPGATGGGKVLASFPLSTSGPLITEDANTVAHVYWNGTALVDSKGNAWTENGTVPQVTANPFTVERFGSGPFSAANYYSLGTGDDVLDFAGDITVCVVFSGLLAGTSEVASDGGFGAAGAGWTLLASATQVIFDTYDAASAYTRASAAAVVTSGPHVICGGRSGSTQYVKGNLVATVSQAGAKTVAATSNPAMIGRRATGAGTAPMEGTIYEVYATTTPFTEATVVAIQQKVLGHFDGTSALAVTRATTATYAPRAADPSTLFTVPAGVARITDEGLLVEPARTNSSSPQYDHRRQRLQRELGRVAGRDGGRRDDDGDGSPRRRDVAHDHERGGDDLQRRAGVPDRDDGKLDHLRRVGLDEEADRRGHDARGHPRRVRRGDAYRLHLCPKRRWIVYGVHGGDELLSGPGCRPLDYAGTGVREGDMLRRDHVVHRRAGAGELREHNRDHRLLGGAA